MWTTTARLKSFATWTTTTRLPREALFEPGGSTVVGNLAKSEALLQPENVAQLVKRHMGEPEWRFSSQGEEFSASEIAAFILRQLAKTANDATGETVEDVVITVPAYFGDEERRATTRAGEMAGLKVVDIINEPTAAAYSYGLAQADSREETVLVYDLGGGPSTSQL